MSEQTKIDDGGAAFPSAADSVGPRAIGMTLRDYLAGRAMQGILSAGTIHEDGDDGSFIYNDNPFSWDLPGAPEQIAKLAVEAADALIVELSKRP